MIIQFLTATGILIFQFTQNLHLCLYGDNCISNNIYKTVSIRIAHKSEVYFENINLISPAKNERAKLLLHFANKCNTNSNTIET